MSRLNDGAPLLYQHDADKIVGVVERAYIKDKRAYAKVKMANNELGREMQELIKDGIIRNVSFGYKINAMDEDRSTDPVTYRATSYQPFEVSLVTVPADNSVGIGRSFQHNGDVETASAVQTNTFEVTMSETPDIGAHKKNFSKKIILSSFLTSQILISVTSHFGGSMTHGVDYLKIPEFENKTALVSYDTLSISNRATMSSEPS